MENSNIESWEDWPEDVRKFLWELNRLDNGARLRFSYTTKKGTFPHQKIGGFECSVCSEQFSPNQYGDACLDGKMICDDCLIAWARKQIKDG